MTLKIDLQRTTSDLIQHIEASATRLEKFEGLRRGGRGDPVPLTLLRRESRILLRRSLVLAARALKVFVRYRMPGG